MLNCQDSGRWSIEKNNIWFIGRPHHSDTMKICYIVRQQYCSCSIGHASVEEWNLSNADANYPQIIGRLGKLICVQFISSQYFMFFVKSENFSFKQDVYLFLAREETRHNTEVETYLSWRLGQVFSAGLWTMPKV